VTCTDFCNANGGVLGLLVVGLVLVLRELDYRRMREAADKREQNTVQLHRQIVASLRPAPASWSSGPLPRPPAVPVIIEPNAEPSSSSSSSSRPSLVSDDAASDEPTPVTRSQRIPPPKG